MMRLSDMLPARTDRALFVGQTGSGKTTLAQHLLNARRYVVVLDVKGTLNWRGYELHRSLARMAKSDAERLIYRPPYNVLEDDEEMDGFFRWIYLRRNTTVYVDETAGVTNGDNFPYHFGACYMRGRELGVEMWCATQRPMRIPQIVMSEAEHVYVFKLRMPQDRLRVESITGIANALQFPLRKREYLYAPQDGDVHGPLTLAL